MEINLNLKYEWDKTTNQLGVFHSSATCFHIVSPWVLLLVIKKLNSTTAEEKDEEKKKPPWPQQVTRKALKFKINKNKSAN